MFETVSSYMKGVGINSGQWVPFGPKVGTRVGFAETASGSRRRAERKVKCLMLMI
jgi:hypothetical protein